MPHKFLSEILIQLSLIWGTINVECSFLAKSNDVKLELSKLLVYEEGASLPLQDFEATDESFGKMVICLASNHRGGDLVINYKGEEMRVVTRSTSESDFTWAFWPLYKQDFITQTIKNGPPFTLRI